MKIEVKIDFKGLLDVQNAVSGPAGRAAVMDGLKAGAFLVQSTAQQSILAGGKSGRTYGKRGHRASAPGEPPANDTGTLVRGISVQVGSDDLSYDVNSLADYAGFLEFGTSKMAPRPYLQPAAIVNLDKIAKLILDKLRL